VYSSPLERALETAGEIAKHHDTSPVALDDLGEVRSGSWEGRSFAELESEDEWRRYNRVRSLARPPGGELMIETQLRMVRQLEALARRHGGEMVAAVSHGDPLRAAVAYYLGIPLDKLLSFEIGVASVSVVELGETSRVLCVNEIGDVPL
jgi:ribonuclease H / adenosylcobalamin/alpha-ribazole phosphatase